ncbi:UNVERIFIED_CONTAM: putative U-box domain-containing protein 42 [Sesamum calycinum]|uniref:RING-type E3 ubiquitin transferase n=1 Tax=Sesamum calycinum TaxID=2727403 RepID=A0AAW2SWM6_9LAMI
MSISSSDWSQLRDDRSPVSSLVESLLSGISEIINSVVCIQVERETFTEIGCYFYRASAIIMELHINWNTPTSTVEVLQSMCRRVDMAKSFTIKLEKNTQNLQYSEVRNIVQQLEEAVKSIGENLSLIPLSVYRDQEYAEKAAKSLSKDIKDVSFVVSPSQQLEPKQKLTSKWALREERKQIETDLYSINVDVSAENLWLSDETKSYLTDIQERPRILNKHDSKSLSAGSSLTALPQLAQYMEPLYETFFCPLTKRIMDDPVTVESGETYERTAITEWFDKFADPEEIVCPRSGQKLKSRILSTNVALKATIDEWKERNEAARIKVARAALSLASTENMVLEAIDDLRNVCKNKPYNKVQVRSIGMIPLLTNFLDYRSRNVRYVTVELLRQLAEDDEEGKSLDAFASEKADQILRNLERVANNIKLMAENGYWEPLLTHLVEGSEEMRMEMASYLGEIVLGPDSKTYVAERASPALIQMIMVEEMFTQTSHNEPMNSTNEAATILANILESGLEVENFQVNTHGHTMASDYMVYNIVTRIKNSTPDDLNINLIRILLCLIKFPKGSGTVVSVVKETEASYNLIELINTPSEELGVASIKLLITLSAFIGHTLSDRLCKTKGQPESLIQNPTEITRITEKHAVSASFLAKLPHQNLTLNLALINSNTIPTVIRSISQIQMTGTRSSRYASAYFEGLVGILVRLTMTLYDHQILFTARNYNFVSVLTELLTRSFTDEVQKLSAIGLENLSKQSISLSRPPRRKKTKILKLIFFRKCISIKLSKDETFLLCPIHGGVCSSQDTFCLLDAQAVERLLVCLDHENVEVIEAALSALSTLLDDKVNVDKSISLLSEKHAIRHVLNVVKEHKEEALWQKAFWMIERFLMKGGDESASNISSDKLFPATLVSAFHHGDDSTRRMAERILRHLNKMPDLSSTLTFTK